VATKTSQNGVIITVMAMGSDRFPDTKANTYAFGDAEWKKIVSESSISINLSPPVSDWECVVISNGQWSTTFRPVKGSEPNWFHRKMQELCFGIKWRKVK